mgnify:CR=1 FL=1
MQIPFINQAKKKPTAWIVGLIAAGLLGTAATVPLVLRNTAPQIDAEQTVPVQTKNVTARITASGEVVPIQAVNLNPRDAGILEKLFVKQGDQVKQGQLIAQMENRRLQADLAQAQAQVAEQRANVSLLRSGNRPEAISQAQSGVNQAQAQINEAQAAVLKAEAQVAQSQARLEKAKADYDRFTWLSQQGAVPVQQLDTARQDYQLAVAQKSSDERGVQQAQAALARVQAGLDSSQQQLQEQQSGARIQEIQQAEARLASAEANLQLVQTKLNETNIRAPFDGVITQRGANEGAFVSPTSFAADSGSATSIATLAKDLEIEAKVPEANIRQIKVGQAVEIRADAYPNQTFRGTVDAIAPEAITDQNVTLFNVKVKLLDGQDKLLSKMNTDLAFLGDQLTNVLMVPVVAISTEQGQQGIWILDRDNKPKFQSVTTGPIFGKEIQILEGLQAGDRVLLEKPAQS